MANTHPVPELPADAPQAGETYKHYKRHELYKVVGLAIDSVSDEWVVVYEPMYENAVAKLFTRPVSQWRDIVEWEGAPVGRFAKM